MQVQLKTVPVALCDIVNNPRSRRDPDYCRSLGENIKANGQKVPVIGYFTDGRFVVADGGCRVEGVRAVGSTEVLALDLGKEPTEADLLMAQASIDLFREHLPPVDRARLFQSAMKARGCSARQLACDLKVSETRISRYQKLLALAPDLQEAVNAGALDISKAFDIADEPDHVRQRELAALAPTMTRDRLATEARKLHNGHKRTIRQSRARLLLTSGVNVTVAGGEMSLEELIEALQAALEAARRANKDQLDIRTFERVLRDKAKGGANGRAGA